MFKDFFMINNDISRKVKAVFYAGCAMIIYLAYIIAGEVSTIFTTTRLIYNGNNQIIGRKTNSPNLFLGIVIGFIVLVLLMILWRKLNQKLFFDNNVQDGILFSQMFSIGKLTATKVINILFYSGVLIFSIPGISISQYLNHYSQSLYRPLMNFSGFISFILVYLLWIIIWKLFCELLLIIFRCFETYYQSKKKEL
ncbi:hypothetical protein [Sporosalibacterium faouarense]|uniref:hypothetical protein n=1 Tax=Sporosalibacterium faouarense TaxID=516123 RepID=UPI00141CE286|nr:hypothetical protein [Sporosalibacterium faouarense]MTI47391.1 hypothetical protein [Bacillota bacterium]